MDKQTLQKMGMDCIALITRKIKNEMSADEYYIELMNLHKKYPMPGHEPELTQFQLMHYYEIEQEGILIFNKKNGEQTEVRYRDHIQPLNFQEAAEMYIRHRENKPQLPEWVTRLNGKSIRVVRDKKIESTGEREDEVPF